MAVTATTIIITGTIITTITMAEPDQLLRLFTWLSPAFPIGGFAYSQGLETAIAGQRVLSRETLGDWIAGQLHMGPLRTDAYFLAIAARAVSNNDVQTYEKAAELALALQASAERHAETTTQAQSFLEAALIWSVDLPAWLDTALARPVALPIAFGAMAASHRVDLRGAIMGFVNAAVAQQISVAVRLVPLGQTQGLMLQAALEPEITALAQMAVNASVEDIASMAYGTDIASLRHEDLSVRIFRS